jgi:hypothetical protein
MKDSETYQDVWINGNVIEKGVRECAPRYEVIKNILERFERPITVLDLGANFGYYSFRIAEDFDACCVMIEHPRAGKLVRLCDRQFSDRLIVLDRRVTIAEVKELSRCEYFDVVLALNIIHHIGPGCQKAIRHLGQIVIVETPSAKDSGACKQGNLKPIQDYWHQQSKVVLGRFSRHTSNEKSSMFLVENPAGHLTKPYYQAPAITKKTFDGGMIVQSDYKTREATHAWKMRKKRPGGYVKNWVPGINLRTYQKLNGIWPTREHLKTMIRERRVVGLRTRPHGDLTIWNMILDGKHLHSIDPKPWMKNRIDADALERVANEL